MVPKNNQSGFFITFEGIEGVGKSTLQNTIATTLKEQGFQVVVTREPGGTKFGEMLRKAILSPRHETIEPITELLVMYAARAQHVANCIKPALAAGKIVLCDRFSDTSFAYQGGGRELPMAWLEMLVKITHADLQPDLTLWLDLAIDEALARTKKRNQLDRIEKEKRSFFERARKTYQMLYKEHPERIVRLNAKLTPKALAEKALKLVLERIEKGSGLTY